MKNTATLLLSVMVVAACAMTSAPDGSPRGVTLTAAHTGPTVMLTLRNDSGAAVGYNLCSSTLQRRAGGTWENVPTGLICTMEIRNLDSGGTATFEHTLPGGLATGEYRYVTIVDANGSRAEAASNPFSVS
ncbi:MAG TPA: hypothetical protein VGQ76_19535 [Thermoanaerobaculia bacterium]|jgi:hypothetical protein|nr:hypothetical protein [Thermoanaerobaculia bacterium]